MEALCQGIWYFSAYLLYCWQPNTLFYIKFMAKTKKSKKAIEETPVILPTALNVNASIKHLLECKCFLPQFKNSNPQIFHKFLVFSEIDCRDGSIVPSYAQCNNCGVIHKVIEIETSIILKKENMSSLLTINDIKTSIPPRLAKILEQNECDLPYWQEAQFIIKNSLWGQGFVLTKEREGTNILGKYIVILGTDLYQISPFQRSESLV